MWRFVVVSFIAGFIGFLGLFARTYTADAKPATLIFTVNDTTDLIDDNVSDSICHTVAGTCTLRAAIMQANALGGSNIINLPAGNYTLTVPGIEEDYAAAGDLDIRTDLTISGSDAANTIVDGNGIDRVFEVFSPSQVSIANITIRNGNSRASVSARGGGIRNNAGTVTLSDLIISGNTAVTGGGFNNQGTAILVRITLKDNVSDAGGGIYDDGILTVSDSSITNNRATLASGGVLNWGTVVMTDVSISGNVVSGTNAFAGGFGNFGTGNATLTNVSIFGNSATYHSGGLANGTWLTITNSNIFSNTAPSAAGIMNVNPGNIVVNNSAIYANRASIDGGGVENSGILTMTNVTVSSNSARYVAGGFANGGQASLINVTMNANTITDTTGTAGNIYNGFNPSSSIMLNNTIVANARSGGNCAVASSLGVISLGHNLSSDATCTLASTGDLTNTDPLLGPLLLNPPGSTPTHALLPGSPAINAGDNSGCPTTDQRGLPRPWGGICDIGAYEFGSVFIFLPITLR